MRNNENCPETLIKETDLHVDSDEKCFHENYKGSLFSLALPILIRIAPISTFLLLK